MGSNVAGKVVHCKKEKYDVYIGRDSKWGNPFFIENSEEKCDPRFIVYSHREAVEKYAKWFLSKPHLMTDAKKELKGKILGCWCKSNICHGDFLVQFLDKVDYTTVESPKTLHPKN